MVVFEADDTTYIILVEAKAFTSWGNTQMGSKLSRLNSIVADTVPHRQDVQLRLVLTSFEKPAKLNLNWGSWANEQGPVHVKLDTVPGRSIIAECDAEGHRKAHGGYVHVKSDS